ncbi:MAG: Transcriptional regulator, MarR family [Klenkia sp.]|nr:Transcriptional regulator, MarR family [Klenkia sp.]
MTRPDTRTASQRLDDVHALSDELARLMRVVHALKTQFAAASNGDAARERAAHVLLFPLTRLGPLRQGALAELLHADPSTVSRHVTLLVERGLVRRVADSSDGRVSRLVVTPDGKAVTEGMTAEREALFARVTGHWTDGDLAALTGLMHRFVDDLTTALPDPTAAAGPSPAVPTPEKDR